MRADTATGEFLGSVERELRVGYESLIQFELNTDDYCFYGFEAVSQADKETSRSDCVEFTQVSKDDAKGIYKYNIKLLKESQDILIRPVCIERPRVVGIEPESLYVTYNQDSTIKFTFNKALKNESLANLIYYIFTDRDINNKFEAPILSQDGKTLFIHPKAGEHIIEPDGTESVLNLKIDYDFTGVVDQDDLSLTSKGSHEYKISKSFTGEQIAKVFIPAKNSSGYFSSSGEKSCTVGYSLELQYTLTDDSYTFVDFEAVSNDGDNSVSRNSSVSFEDKYYNQEAGMFRAKLFVNELYDDILIRPVLKELPAVKEHTSTNGSETLSVDKPIKIVFNTEIDIQKVLNTISVICKTNDESLLETCFKEPVYDSLSHVLTLYPEPLLLKDYIDNLHAGTVDLQISLDKEIRNSTFTIRYKADVEKTAPSAADFIVSRNPITLENASGTNESYKLSLKAIDITADEIPAADIQKNRAGNGAVYIYGRYFDEESGVKDVVVSERMLQDNGELSSAAETTFNSRSDSQIAQFTSDGQGNTSFVIKYDFANLDKAYVLDIVVRDNCDNRAATKTVSVFVPVYGEALGDSFYYLKNKPDYENEDLTIEQYSAELKNLKIYPTSFAIYQNARFTVDGLSIFCEYKDKTDTNKKQQFNLNEGENPYWNCLLNVDSVSDLQVKITVYDGDNVYDQREFKFPSKSEYEINNITLKDGEYVDRPYYKLQISHPKDNSCVYAIGLNAQNIISDKKTANNFYKDLDNVYADMTWYLGTSNSFGLCSELESFEEQLSMQNNVIPKVQIKNISLDDSGWKTNGGFVNYIVTFADDTWENNKYDTITYYKTPDDDGYWSNIKYYVANKNEYSVTIPVPVTLMINKDVQLYFSGKKNGWMSEATTEALTNLSSAVYDTTPPSLSAEPKKTDPYSTWVFKLVDYESGPKEADFEILGEHFHIDETDNYTVEVDAELIERYRVMTGCKEYCQIKYTASDQAGVTVPENTIYTLYFGPHESFTFTRFNSGFELHPTETGAADISFYYVTRNSWWPYRTISEPDNYVSVSGKDETNNIQSLENQFVRIECGSGNIRYAYIGKTNSKEHDFILANGNSKKSVVVCSDAPVFVHTVITDVSYDICKDWDWDTWEFHKTAKFGKQLDFDTDDYNPKIYSFDPKEFSGDIKCYCVIAHFANGDVLMSQVMQK